MLHDEIKQEFIVDFPGGPVVKTPASTAGGSGSIPGLGSFACPVVWPKEKKKERIHTVNAVHLSFHNFLIHRTLSISAIFSRCP